ncbi:methyltransferase family protein [Sphingomicrobium sediminis]|uniref:Isoprenylcysteine carboxylmethyltransferase family protein n=1 Tax=Sphingomicrobium sediminis TaxID=2950949 RepID=A0A9X2EJH6_9SPHN|nr:isoprenylcysteine carboxylmethyltransferase family protein [Sphingomicrobium sediminis]MCM8557926.1 isoprenylcysteine carboxylmethyltransferase family protein [Sphingomicrobium sediminis]
MARTLALLYALVAYSVFFATFLWFVAFVGDIREVMGLAVPATVDMAPNSAAPMMAAIINIGLVALFGVHHSVAARIGFKDKLTQSLPKSVERSTYVLVASILLAVLMHFWHPIEGSVWDLTGTALETPIWVLFAIGWFILFTATWLLNHFELFGLQQAWMHGRGDIPPMSMKTPGWYKLVRHPIYTGFFIAMWAAVEMSYGHLVLAGAVTVYILIGVNYEERDLVAHFGEDYADYRRKVGAILPGLGKARS